MARLFGVPALLKGAWSNLTSSKTSLFYTLMSASYFIVQLLFLIQAYLTNYNTGQSLRAILRAGNINPEHFVLFDPKAGDVIRVCSDIQQAINSSQCMLVWPPTLSGAEQPASPSADVQGNFLGDQGGVFNFDATCLNAMQWVNQVVFLNRRDDLAFIFFQCWILILSAAAVSADSIPHIIASFICHFIAAAYSGYQIARTFVFQADYNRVLLNGACRGQDFMAQYFKSRREAEIEAAVVNGVFLFACGYLTWHLTRTFAWNTFRSVGASVVINRAYRVALALGVTVHLSVFFIVGHIALWLDFLFKPLFGAHPALGLLYKITYIATLVFIFPWLALVWFGVRRESNIMMILFFVFSLYLLVSSWVMMASATWRTLFQEWTFFALIATTAFILTFLSTALAVWARINFGKGLPDYMKGGDLAAGDPTFNPAPDVKVASARSSDYESDKVEFPTHSLPQFTIAYPSPSALQPQPMLYYPGNVRQSTGSSFSRGSSFLRPLIPLPQKGLNREPSYTSNRSSIAEYIRWPFASPPARDDDDGFNTRRSSSIYPSGNAMWSGDGAAPGGEDNVGRNTSVGSSASRRPAPNVDLTAWLGGFLMNLRRPSMTVTPESQIDVAV